MGRTEGLTLKELSHDFGKVTAPWISTPHITKIPTVPNAKQQQTSTISNKETGAQEEARV